MTFFLSEYSSDSTLPLNAEQQLFKYFQLQYDLKTIIDLVLKAEQINIICDFQYKFDFSATSTNFTAKRTLTLTFSEDSSERTIVKPHTGRFLSQGEVCIRQLLSNAPKEQWIECLQLINEQIDSLPPIRQAIVALMVPDAPELSHKVARHLLSLPKVPFTVKGLILTATEDEIVQKIVNVKPDFFNFYNTESSYILDWGKIANTLFVEKQEKALDILLPEATNEHCGFLLAHINDPRAIEALATAGKKGDKKCLANFHLSIKHWPTAAIIALSNFLANAKKDYDFARLALIQLTIIHSEKVPAILAWLDEPAANILSNIINQSIQIKEASIDKLPQILVTPSWTIKTNLEKQQTVLKIKPLTIDPIEQWEEQKKDKLLKKKYYYYKRLPAFIPDTFEDILEATGFKRYEADDYRLFLEKAILAEKNNDIAQILSAFDELFQYKKQKTKNKIGNSLFISAPMLAKLPQQLAVTIFNRHAGQFDYLEDLDYFAAKFGFLVIPGIISTIQHAPEKHMEIALHFGTTELAPIMARAFHKLKKFKQTGERWLLAFPEHAIHALIAPALGRKGENQECATAALRFLNIQGHGELIIRTASKYQDGNVETAIEELLKNDEIIPPPVKIPVLPSFWQPGSWTRPILVNGSDAGKVLPISAINHIGTMLAYPSAEKKWYNDLYEVKNLCTPESLAAFAWDMFSTWLNHGAPSKDKWAFLALGLFGNDDIARKLTPYIREWPGMAAHVRAVQGLDILEEIGTDVALMQLNGISQKVKFKGLRDNAREKINQIAKKLKLTREELEDCLVPQLGLNNQGTMLLDFGPRQFIVGFDEALKPYIRDTNGKRMANLPKPGKSDDENLAFAATESFKNLKKDVRTIANQQILRLEQAMCSRRHWKVSSFEAYIAKHPLLRHLASRLIWAAYKKSPNKKDQTGNPDEVKAVSFFRLNEDGSYTTAQDTPFNLPDDKNIQIAIPHILDIPKEVATEFGQLLTDYELIQPFPQLGRESFYLTENEKNQTEFTRWNHLEIPTGRILSLTRKGWYKGTAMDAGWIDDLYKTIGNKITIGLFMSKGYSVGYTEMNEPQTIESIQIGASKRSSNNIKPLVLQDVDPIVISELIRDIESITK